MIWITFIINSHNKMNDYEITKQRMISKIDQTKRKAQQIYQNMQNNQMNKRVRYNSPQLQSIHIKDSKVYQKALSNQNKVLSKLSDKLEDNYYRLKAIQSFPFGKQRTKIVQMISDKMDPRQDEYNKNMLNKFRIDAIQYRNNRKMNDLNKQNVYLSQSMMPTLNNNTFIMPIENPQKILLKQQPQSYQYYLNSKQNQGMKLFHQHLPIIQTRSIGVDTTFIKIINKKGYKSITKPIVNKRKKSNLRYEKLSQMINDLNYQVKKNRKILSQSIMESPNHMHPNQESSQEFVQKPDYDKIKSNKQHNIKSKEKKLSSPFIVYTEKDNQRFKTIEDNDVKKHLVLLNRNRKRLQTINT